jgi:hypothetical protein
MDIFKNAFRYNKDKKNETNTGKISAGLVPKTKIKPIEIINTYFNLGLPSRNDLNNKKQPMETKTYPVAVGTSFIL